MIRKDRIIIMSIILIVLLNNCSEKHESSINDIVKIDETNLNNAFSLQKDDKKISCLLLDSSKVKILFFTKDKEMEKYIKIAPKTSVKFRSIVKHQLLLKNVMHYENNDINRGYDITFYTIYDIDYLSATYKNVSNYKKDISHDFDFLLNTLLTENDLKFF